MSFARANQKSVEIPAHRGRRTKQIPPVRAAKQIPAHRYESQCPCDGFCPLCHPGIQAKLTIGSPNDIYEQEADRMADEVMRMPESQPTVDAPCRDGASCQREEDIVRLKLSGGTRHMQEVPNMTRPSCGISSTNNGRPLSGEERSFMERRFSVDFGDVRIHTDSSAAAMNKSLNAHAFTHGRDIFFGEGRYCSGSPSTRRLLAHELTHVVQQKGRTPSLQMEAAEGRCQIIGDVGNFWFDEVFLALDNIVYNLCDPDEPGFAPILNDINYAYRSADCAYQSMRRSHMGVEQQYWARNTLLNLARAREVAIRDDPSYMSHIRQAREAARMTAGLLLGMTP